MPVVSTTPLRRRSITGRALVLGTLVVLLLVLLAAPLNRYFGSRTDVNQAAQQLYQDKAKLKSLTAQQAQWGDPTYVEQQARMRLEYAMPGDTVYVVVDKGATSRLQKAAAPHPSKPVAATWNARLWDSVQAAAG